jgi:lysophospholipase L1-like esterase
MYPTRKRIAVAILCAALAIGTAVALATGTANAESNGGVRVMPLGDSITDGLTVPGGYRIGLWQRLGAAGNTVDFVGSLSNGPSSLGDHDHEGHSGWRIDQIDANVVGWLRTTTPHTVLLHIGTNDVLQNLDLPNAPARLSTLIDHITATLPTAEVFVATIIPLGSAQEANVRTFNAAIPGIVQSKVNAGRHVHFVDMHAALTPADLADGIHPNAGGYDKMATVWFAQLRLVPGSIDGVPPSSPPPTTPPPTTAPPPTTSGSGGCSITLVPQTTWQTGYVIQPSRVTNTGTSTINSWTVRVTLPAGHAITGFWNATESVNAQTVTFHGVSFNSTLAPGASGEFGFQASRPNGNTALPTATCSVP